MYSRDFETNATSANALGGLAPRDGGVVTSVIAKDQDAGRWWNSHNRS